MRRIMTRGLGWLLTVTGTILPFAAAAQDFYAGVGVGVAEFEGSCNSAERFFDELLRCEHNDSDRAWRVFAGYRVNQWFSVQAAYADLGGSDTASSETVNGRPTLVVSTIDVDGYSIEGVCHWQMFKRLKVLANFGAFNWDVRFRSRITQDRNTVATGINQSGTDSTGGLRLHYRVSDRWAVQGGWQFYASEGDHFDVYLVEAVARFR